MAMRRARRIIAVAPAWLSANSQNTETDPVRHGRWIREKLLAGRVAGHHTWCSSLGAYKANERLSSIKWATVDFELADLFPSPFHHIDGIEKGFSARGPQQPNYAFGSPKIAMQE